MADTFFGFNTDIPAYEDEPLNELDPSLTEADLLNDDTFGDGALAGDWEHAHRKLAELEVRSSGEDFEDVFMKEKSLSTHGIEHGIGTILDVQEKERNTSELEEEEEMLEQTLVKLVDDDDVQPAKVPSRNKGLKGSSGLTQPWSGESPLSIPASSKSLHELISPESYIWGTPPKLDKENTTNGSSNARPTPTSRKPYRRPSSPAFEDESIVQALPQQDLLPPSQFSSKIPLPPNAIRLEDLEKELTTDNPPRKAPVDNRFDPHMMQQGRHQSLLRQPPPGIPQPMMTPPGLPQPMMTPSGLPRPMMTPSGLPRPMMTPSGLPRTVSPLLRPGMHPLPHQMYHNMQSPINARAMPNPAMYRTPPFLHRPQFPMVHSDPGHLRHHRGMDMPMMMSPQQMHRRFSTPQPQMQHQFDDRRNWPQDQRGHYNNNNYNNNNYNQRFERSFPREQMEPQYQPSDLERKIHKILGDADEQRNADDPYAGLMTRREKEWLIKIQLLQLTSSNPQLDDYYFQTYTQRKVSKERASQSEGVEHRHIQDNNTYSSPEMALPQFERDRERRNYKPMEFQGSLGKLSSSSVQHPRQVIDLSHINRVEQDKASNVPLTKDSKRRGRLLAILEKGYDCLLNLEDLEKKLPFASDLERSIIVEAKKVWLEKFFILLKLNKDMSSSHFDDEQFVQLLSIQKGKSLLSRVLPILTQEQADAISLAVTRNISVLIKKDIHEEGLLLLVTPLSRVLEMSSWNVILQALQNVVQSAVVGAASPLSAVLINKFGTSILGTILTRVRVLSNALTEADEDSNQSWQELVKKVAKEFQDVPVKLLAKNLEGSTKLVALVSSCTDPLTAATVQEHLRTVGATRAEIQS